MSDSVISLKHAYIYQNDNLILSNVNFNVAEGEFVYLIGKTGSGKSSLLKTLYADLWLQSGKGTVVNYHLDHLKQAEIPFLRRQIGIVFQDYQLLPDRDIEANLGFFLQAMDWTDMSKIKNRIKEVLNLVGLLGALNKKPHQLSGGEQQRVSIARALLNYPKIIIADEPTGNLDPEKSIEILNLFFKINQNEKTAILMATHQLDLIHRFPKRTVNCENGELIELSDN